MVLGNLSPPTDSVRDNVGALTSSPAAAGAGGGKGGAKGKEKREERTMIRFKEKPMDADIFLFRGFYQGAHFPLATFTDNPSFRSTKATNHCSQRRKNKKGEGNGKVTWKSKNNITRGNAKART